MPKYAVSDRQLILMGPGYRRDLPGTGLTCSCDQSRDDMVQLDLSEGACFPAFRIPHRNRRRGASAGPGVGVPAEPCRLPAVRQ